jgi:hypothetical protein
MPVVASLLHLQQREDHRLGALKRDAGRGASRPQTANLNFSPRRK